MAPAPAGTPWWVWLAVVFGTAVVAATPATIAAFRNGKHGKQAADNSQLTAENTQVIKEQVKNSHPTNLRDDLDRVDTKVDRLYGVVDAHHADITEQIRDLRAALLRQDRIAARHHPEET